ncbi:EFh [Nesidiocoris tenuis]|uniref:EFh n=1 Tax=Nesidiocoris tenuis TaxID=355587 RepID=A0ABN7BDJ7_9HEMI|nr:EFh [Nesidiocoris tenuis]
MSQNFAIFVPVILYAGLVGLAGHLPTLRSTVRPTIFRTSVKIKASLRDPELNESIPPIELLTVVFKRADVSGDQLLELEELANYIHLRTKSHIEESLQENYGLFMVIDKSPRNGVVSWSEYHDYFLMKHGVDEEYIRNHNEKHPGMGRSLKESIARDKASWSEAAKSDPEYLTLDEFLAFRHPESSANNILTLVDDLLDKLDRDGDEMLTEEEFAVLQVSGGVGETLVSQGEEQRRSEFRSAIDKDNNLLADRKELLRYIDPRNPRHAREEALTLVTLADADKDGRLSLDEVLTKMDLFLASKMVNTAKSFHDEF